MEVHCTRCSTEYDFDDALISERGTTVQCTNCGFQFKLFPMNPHTLGPERWIVRTEGGQEHLFSSLRELQRSISNQTVGPNDLLSRGQQAPRPLGSIAELEQFFLSSDRPGPPFQKTPSNARQGEAPVQTLPPPDFFGTATETTQATARESSSDVQRSSSQRITAASPLVVLPQAGSRESSSSKTFGEAPPQTPASGPLKSNSSVIRPEPRSSPRASTPIGLPPVSSRRRDLRSYDEILVDELPDPRRRARSRWIAAVVIGCVFALFALTVGRRYLSDQKPAPAVQSDQSSDKVAALLKSGNQMMAEGRFEEAAEELTRASTLSERDPDVLAGLARLSVLRADVYWLKLRLINPEILELVQSIQRELGRHTGRARASVDAAFAVAPENLVVLRARVDALRLSGDHDAAREWIKPIASRPADPENAYVLAALDLAEAQPSWQTIIDRLKTASSGARAPGRAHAALIYALVRAGRSNEAQAELGRLEADPRGALLLDELRAFFQREVGSASAAPPPQTPAAPAPATPGGPNTLPVETRRAPTGDFRSLLEQASTALRSGQLDRAETLYEQVLALRPGNTEAVAGLGDVARRRNDPASASRMYDRVLNKNPNYIPAMLARADLKWDAGDRKGALELYRQVLDQAGIQSDYGQRASLRIAQAAREATEEPDAPEPFFEDEDPAPVTDNPYSTETEPK